MGCGAQLLRRQGDRRSCPLRRCFDTVANLGETPRPPLMAARQRRRTGTAGWVERLPLADAAAHDGLLATYRMGCLEIQRGCVRTHPVCIVSLPSRPLAFVERKKTTILGEMKTIRKQEIWYVAQKRSCENVFSSGLGRTNHVKGSPATFWARRTATSLRARAVTRSRSTQQSNYPPPATLGGQQHVARLNWCHLLRSDLHAL